jgi:hypothetical protein
MARQLTPEQFARIRTFDNRSVREAARLADVGVSSVVKARRAPAPGAPVEAPVEATPPLACMAPAPEGPVEPVALTTHEEVIAFAQTAAGVAVSQSNLMGMISAARLAAGSVVALHKEEPPPIVNPETWPDMLRAAQECRDGLHADLERLAADIAALPPVVRP